MISSSNEWDLLVKLLLRYAMNSGKEALVISGVGAASKEKYAIL